MSAPADGVSVSGGRGSRDGPDGTVVTGITGDDVAGLPAGAGCLPALDVTKTAETPRLHTATGATAVWTLQVRNAEGRGRAGAVEITDNLPAQLVFAATWSISTTGGARRTDLVDPTLGSSQPRWGTFEIPAGGAVEIVVAASVPSELTGSIGNGARVTLDTEMGPVTAGLPLDEGGADHITLTPYACDDPSTDDVFASNSYLAVLAPAPAGATELVVGPTVGGQPPTPGDIVLILQMDGVDAGLEEYARVAALEGDRLVLQGERGGGLINTYGLDGAAEVVRVPVVPSMVVDGPSTVPTWDGSTGGVFAADVVGPLVLEGGSIDVSATGRTGKESGAGSDATPSRLVTGVGKSPGGGVVAMRALSVGGTASIVADSGDKGGAGTVLLVSPGGDLSGLDVSASGSKGAGAVLLSSEAARIKTTGKGHSTVRTDVTMGEIPGTALGACARRKERRRERSRRTRETATPRSTSRRGGRDVAGGDDCDRSAADRHGLDHLGAVTLHPG